jgi:hypothetical protein
MAKVMNTYMPGIRIMLTKSIVRPERVSIGFGARPGDSIDITDWLGESGYVVTSKDLYSPTGIFEIAFPDTVQVPRLDSIYEIIEPMDRINIHFARNRHEYAGGLLPIVMRGFVRDLQRTEVMGEDGKPHRRVLVRGADYGIFGDLAIMSTWHASAMGRSYVPQILQMAFGLRHGGMTIKEFVDDVLEYLINQQIRDLQYASGQPSPPGPPNPNTTGIPPLLGDTASVTAGSVHINGADSFDGTAWGYLHKYINSPWNELFIEEGADAPYLVFRPTPWKTLAGDWIDNLGQAVAAVEVEDTFDFVRSANYRRTDHHVVNLVWAPWTTTAAPPLAVYANLMSTASPELYFPTQHYNSAERLYGFRMLQHPVSTQPDVATHTQGNHISEHRQAMDNLYNWSLLHSRWLRDANWDNVLFEEGELAVRGNERAKIGTYYTLTRGRLRFTHYLTRVTHQFRPYQAFTTTLGFIRSTNFYERLRAPRPPFLLEGKKGAYAT